MHSKLDTKSTV